MLDLNIGVRPDEVGHFYLQPSEPDPSWLGWRWLCRLTWWDSLYKADGSKAKFKSVVLFWFLQLYWGTAKCDGTRTFAARASQYGEPAPKAPTVVMTDLKKELFSFRFRSAGLNKTPVWSDMGGS